MNLAKYLALFVSEAGEHLEALGAELVRFEAAARAGEPVAEIVDAMFRRAHSVKGMAGSMEQDGIACVAHGAEDLLGALRHGAATPGPEVVDVLLAAVDALQAMVERASTGEVVEADAAVVARLGEIARAPGAAAQAAADPAPAEGDAAAEAAPPAAEAVAPVEPATASPASAEAPRHRFSIEAAITDACPVPAVRGFLVVKKLAALGGLVESSPTVEDLRAGRIPGRKLRLVVETAEGRQAIERTLSQIAELGAVSIRDAEPAVRVVPREPERAEAARTVRVRTDLLDQFLDLVGELLLASARIREVARSVPDAHRPPLDDEVDRLHSTVKDLHDKVMTVRMTPVALVTDQLPRTTRDLARRTGKQVDLEVEGAGIEIDRAILDEIADPLLHVLRNAVDHGIEAPHLRLLAGKPATGRILVQARRERDRVVIEVQDDGRGMDAEGLRRAAVSCGAVSAAEAAALSSRECFLLACVPGVSTADAVTDLSGRGVGMDAVKQAVEAVGGAIDVESVPGEGTRVILRLPLTVAVQPVLLVRAGGEVVGLPIAKVRGAAEVDVQRLDRSRGDPVLSHGGRLVPVRELAALLGFEGPPRVARAVVIAEGDGAPVGLAVEELLGQQEAVLKPVTGPMERVAGLSAVTVLGSGRPVFILDVQRLVAA